MLLVFDMHFKLLYFVKSLKVLALTPKVLLFVELAGDAIFLFQRVSPLLTGLGNSHIGLRLPEITLREIGEDLNRFYSLLND